MEHDESTTAPPPPALLGASLTHLGEHKERQSADSRSKLNDEGELKNNTLDCESVKPRGGG